MTQDASSGHRITVAPERRAVQVLFHDAVIASTTEALALSENGYPPVLYIPKKHVEMSFLHETDKRSTCPYKGEARYWSISAEGYGEENAVWAYDQPKQAVRQIADYVAFYPDKVRIAVGDDR